MHRTWTIAIWAGLLACGQGVALADGPMGDANAAPSSGATASGSAGDAGGPTEPEELAVSFQDMAVQQVGTFLSEQLGKPVLVDAKVKETKLTVVSKRKLPRDEALELVYEALLAGGVVVDEGKLSVRLRPLSEVMQTHLMQIGPDRAVAELGDVNRMRIVRKTFELEHYDVGKMVRVLEGMLPEYGRILADPDTRRLIVVDTIANLLRMEPVVEAMDVPLARRTETKILKVRHGDAAEIVSIVRYLIAGRLGIEVGEIETSGVGDGASAGRGRSGGNGPGGPSAGGEKSTTIEPSEAPVTLMPHVSRNWIIAIAPASVMVQIEQWVADLDKAREVEQDYELLTVRYASVGDVAEYMTRTLRAMPNPEVRDSTHVVPFGASKQLIVFGSKTGRELVADLLEKLDKPEATKRERKNFALEHADAEEMAERIEELFSAMEEEHSYSSRYYSSTSYRRDPSAATVRVVPDKRRNSITVITDPVTMGKVAELIREEDRPVDVSDVKPRTYEIKYISPVDLQKLLTEMFSGKQERQSFWDIWYGESEPETKPIGRLLGQFTFQVLPGTNKLIVNTKSTANFEVIEELIAELDQPQKAGLPIIVELRHANAEDLAEQLNALLAQPGVSVGGIRRADRGLLDSSHASANRGAEASASEGEAARRDPETMDFWWSKYRPPADSEAASNLVGSIRIVPVIRRNALMVLAPEGYKEPIRKLVAELDEPGRQVLIHARIGEIQHEDQTTLGLRIASDPALLGSADTAIGGSVGGEYTEPVFGGTTILSARANVAALLNMLMRNLDMKILLEPTITTSDNQASQYFDGQDVTILTQSRTSSEGASTVTDREQKQVGTLLRVRPHITKDGGVDLLINLELSRIVPGTESAGNFIFDRREVTTHVIVQDGQTIMLSGIIRQEEFDDVRKVPLLGDLPLIGPAFRSIDRSVRNRELVVFITPHVMAGTEDVDRAMSEPRKTLDHLEEGMPAVNDGRRIAPRGDGNRQGDAGDDDAEDHGGRGDDGGRP